LVKVLGSGSANCLNTARLIEMVARAKGVSVHGEEVTDIAQIMMSTHGVVIDGKVAYAGGVPGRNQVEG
jgi:hypothetical protein